MAIKVIIFDLWNTLGKKEGSLSKRLAEHFQIVRTADFMERYERAIQLQKWRKKQDLSKGFLQAFNLPVTEENVRWIVETQEHTVNYAALFGLVPELLAQLHAKYKLALLSNTTVFETQVIKRWGIDQLFDFTGFPYETGFIKPDEGSFAAVCKALQVKPEECVFIDDSETNVQQARSYGMRAIQFVGIDALRKELQQLQLL